jgi:predicted nucleic acid-binding protein
MSLLADIPEGCLVGLDTMIWIYETEGHPAFGPVAHPFFAQRLALGNNRAGSSLLTLGELLVQPLIAGQLSLIHRYRQQFTAAPNFTAWDITRDVVEQAAELRAKYRLKMLDALHLASAVMNRADLFLSNESAFRKVTEIKVLVLADYLPPSP